MKTIDTKLKLWVYLHMRKSPPLPLIIIISAFIIIPVVFWVFTFRNNADNVRGTTVASSGVLVKIISEKGSWDMSKYLCEDISTCLESLTSGKSLEKTSGGWGAGQTLVIRPTSDWSQYEYIKIFVKSGWGSSERFFSASLSEDTIKGGSIEKFNYGGNTYESVILPVEILRSEIAGSVTFSD
jgi:hypothetical protein